MKNYERFFNREMIGSVVILTNGEKAFIDDVIAGGTFASVISSKSGKTFLIDAGDVQQTFDWGKHNEKIS